MSEVALVDYWPDEDPAPVPPTDDTNSAEYWRWQSTTKLKRLFELDITAGEEEPVGGRK